MNQRVERERGSRFELRTLQRVAFRHVERKVHAIPIAVRTEPCRIPPEERPLEDQGERLHFGRPAS